MCASRLRRVLIDDMTAPQVSRYNGHESRDRIATSTIAAEPIPTTSKRERCAEQPWRFAQFHELEADQNDLDQRGPLSHITNHRRRE